MAAVIERPALLVRRGDEIAVDLGAGEEFREVVDVWNQNRIETKIVIRCPEHPEGRFSLPAIPEGRLLRIRPRDGGPVATPVNLRDVAAARGLHFAGWRPR